MESFEYGRSDLVLLNMNIEYRMNKDVINRDLWFWLPRIILYMSNAENDALHTEPV